MPSWASDQMIALSRLVHAIPDDEAGVAVLVRPSGAPLRLRLPGVDMLAVVQTLQLGTTYHHLVADFFSGDRQVTDAILDRLQSEGLLLRPLRPTELPEPELAMRFDRLLHYFAQWETPNVSRVDYLRCLRSAHVAMLGLGSMASWIIGHLTANGVGRISGIDPDRIESSNLSRQATYAEGDEGSQKVDAMAAAVSRLSGLTEFVGVTDTLTSDHDIERLFSRLPPVDAVMLTADQPLWRITTWVSRACHHLGLPLLRANVSGVGPFKISAESACPSCELAWLENTENASRLLDYRASDRYQSAANSATISTVIAAQGAIAGHELIGHLTGAWSPASVNRRLQVQPGPNFGSSARAVTRRRDCPGCGDGR